MGIYFLCEFCSQEFFLHPWRRGWDMGVFIWLQSATSLLHSTTSYTLDLNCWMAWHWLIFQICYIDTYRAGPSDPQWLDSWSCRGAPQKHTESAFSYCGPIFYCILKCLTVHCLSFTFYPFIGFNVTVFMFAEFLLSLYTIRFFLFFLLAFIYCNIL